MSRRNRIWRVVAVVFTAVNLVGLGMAAAAGEQAHSGVHVALALLGAFGVWRLGARREHETLADPAPDAARLEQLQQSIDAIAFEVERIGEAQRFNAKLQSEQGETSR